MPIKYSIYCRGEKATAKRKVKGGPFNTFLSGLAGLVDNLEVVPNCVVSLYAIDAANTSAVMRLPSVALLALSLRSISSSYAFTTQIRHQTLPTPRTPSSSSLASSTTADEPPKTAALAATPPTSVA
eukprot:scaffold852_cov197-Alexandrium_tamarense.AAC.1